MLSLRPYSRMLIEKIGSACQRGHLHMCCILKTALSLPLRLWKAALLATDGGADSPQAEEPGGVPAGLASCKRLRTLELWADENADGALEVPHMCSNIHRSILNSICGVQRGNA